MYTHPGKKLLFMGCEYGPFREWDFENELEWFMLDYEPHRRLKEFTKALNLFYLAHPALWERDCATEGFEWISPDDNRNNVAVFLRRSDEEELVIAVNFSPQRWDNYRFGLPDAEHYEEIFNSDDPAYGGYGVFNREIVTEPVPMHGRTHSAAISVPPFGAVILKKKPTQKRPRIAAPKKVARKRNPKA